MNEANPQPSYLPNRQVYCLHNLAKSVHIPGKKQIYITFIGHRVRQGIYTIQGKASGTLT